MTFQVESVEDWASESKDLVYAHWQELGLDLAFMKALIFKADYFWASGRQRSLDLASNRITVLGHVD